MKSLLQEATSIQKAIEKAWIEAGRPAQFTINILEKGEKNFLGMTKQPAIVSISYELDTIKTPKDRGAFKKREQKPRQTPSRSTSSHSTPKQREYEQPAQSKQAAPKTTEKESAAAPTKQPQAPWNKELLTDVTQSMREIITKLSIKTAFSTSIKGKILTLTFKQAPFSSAEDERALFASLSYLLLQMLKKKHKRKLTGFRLIITSQKTTNEQQQQQ